MKTKLPFDKQDYKLLRNAGLWLGVCLSFALVLYFGANRVNGDATLALNNARAQFDQATASVQLIAEEEATIILYIDRYQEFVEHGYLSAEDRLDFIESISEIRDANNLFPVGIVMDEQETYSLSYDPMDLNPSEPVDLNYSKINLNLQLLHEEDLTRLIASMLDSGGLLLPTSCRMTHNNIIEVDFTKIAEHMSANCDLYWYTFELSPAEPVYD